ncbi:hypothetical protein KAFR_0A03500 [Kazachstania africana CBS 2517]|uniref:Uncharacterized protein n=1 Tax=Kazachstania africana (strain ATCC 22294 / BCRC 22015 / CBS 2517 / CECT 1963 / NBRC 1671 / NRRL Y-8276) TaxID=1071382 RepID=H2AN35_KAZAF|nr:hypothetical protein KAFR_0A03500 [Kazachstania africana CBS 2517]CCF55785.1 hypothetical protein KAFR_0A03500 [Kazachstania africana CBS 2517]
MAFKKRNKIKVPSLSAQAGGTNVTDSKKPIRLNLSYLEDEEEEEDHASLQIKQNPLKQKKPLILPVLPHTVKMTSAEVDDDVSPERDDEYKDLFKKRVSKPDVKILNLEDKGIFENIDGSDGDEEYMSKEQIERIKQRRRRPFEREARSSEREYVKLLNDEEKLDVIETIKDNGGFEKRNGDKNDNEYIYDFEDEIFEDKLELNESVLSSKEVEKRENVDKILNDDEIGDEWEKHILSKTNNVIDYSDSQDKIRRLPKLFDSAMDDEDEGALLASKLSQITLAKRTKQLRIDALNKQRVGILEERDKLLQKILNKIR